MYSDVLYHSDYVGVEELRCRPTSKFAPSLYPWSSCRNLVTNFLGLQLSSTISFHQLGDVACPYVEGRSSGFDRSRCINWLGRWRSATLPPANSGLELCSEFDTSLGLAMLSGGWFRGKVSPLLTAEGGESLSNQPRPRGRLVTGREDWEHCDPLGLKANPLFSLVGCPDILKMV